MKTIWHRKHGWLEHVHRQENFPHDTIDGKMMGQATRDRKRMELLHDRMEWRDYGQLSQQTKMETGQQVRKHVRNLLETVED